MSNLLTFSKTVIGLPWLKLIPTWLLKPDCDYRHDSLCTFFSFRGQVLACGQDEADRWTSLTAGWELFPVSPDRILMAFKIPKCPREWVIQYVWGIKVPLLLFSIFPYTKPSSTIEPRYADSSYKLPWSSQHYTALFQGQGQQCYELLMWRWPHLSGHRIWKWLSKNGDCWKLHTESERENVQATLSRETEEFTFDKAKLKTRDFSNYKKLNSECSRQRNLLWDWFSTPPHFMFPISQRSIW